MEQLDRDLQKRVWQRVQSREAPIPMAPPMDNLKILILTVQENAAAYQSIARQTGHPNKDRLMALYRESRQCIARLKGICCLRGETVAVPQLPGTKEPARRVLEKCYHRERTLRTEWERRFSDPEHGVVFQGLARQAGEHCMQIAEILGEMA